MTIAHDLSFSVLTAPIAQIDRRALSQAWYSALYPQTPPSRAPQFRASCAQALARNAHTAVRETDAPASRRVRSACARSLSAQQRVEPALERRAEPSALSKRIAGAVHAARRTRHATLRFGSARVQIVLRQHAGAVSIVAICSPAHARSVAQALQQARYALAGRGIALQARTVSAQSEIGR